MSKLNFEYVPLTFISDKEEIKKQIRNTIILIYLFEKYKNPVRLEKLIVGTQYGYNASALKSGSNKFLRISDIHESKVNWETVPFCNCEDEKTYLLENDDILIARTGGTTGKSFKIDSPPKHAIYAGYLIRIRAKESVNPDYIYLFLHSFAYWSQIVNLNEGNFRPKANAENLKALIIPNCSKEIQDEIVKISQGENVEGYEDLFVKIEETLNEYDKSQELESLLSEQLTLIENLNQAILQEAVQGKLVPQDPTDEPASQLLERIKAEKAKIGKKEKPLPPIKKEEIPFEIPENWVWCKIGDVSTSIVPNRDKPKTFTGDITWITQSNFSDYSFKLNYDLNGIGLSEEEVKKYNCRVMPKGSVIMSCVGQFDLVCLVERKIVANQQLHCFVPLGNIDPMYLCYSTKLFSKLMEKEAIHTTIKYINKTKCESILLPLPPLSEQQRIVAEIEKQLGKTKELKAHIIANQQATEQLLKALLHGAFEVEEKE